MRSELELVKLAAFYDELEAMGLVKTAGPLSWFTGLLERGSKRLSSWAQGAKNYARTRAVNKAQALRNSAEKLQAKADKIVSKVPNATEEAIEAAKKAPTATVGEKVVKAPSTPRLDGTSLGKIKVPGNNAPFAQRLKFRTIVRNAGLPAALSAYRREAALIGGGLGAGLAGGVIGGKLVGD